MPTGKDKKMTNQQSFDVYLPDYSSITAEHKNTSVPFGGGATVQTWRLVWVDELAENRAVLCDFNGSRDDVMLHCEALAEAFNGEK